MKYLEQSYRVSERHACCVLEATAVSGCSPRAEREQGLKMLGRMASIHTVAADRGYHEQEGSEPWVPRRMFLPISAANENSGSTPSCIRPNATGRGNENVSGSNAFSVGSRDRTGYARPATKDIQSWTSTSLWLPPLTTSSECAIYRLKTQLDCKHRLHHGKGLIRSH